MPRLPSAEELGLLPSLESRRGIATYDATPLACGAAAIGEGIQKIGNAGLGIGLDMVQRDRRQSETLEDAQAQADLLSASARRRSAIGDATDPADLEKANREGAEADLQAAANRISDPARRELFLARGRPTLDTLGIAAKDKAFNLNSDAKRAEVAGQLESLKKTAIADQDPINKDGHIKAGQALISGLENEGYLTATEAQRQREQWGRSYAIDALNALPPAARLAQARGSYGDHAVLARVGRLRDLGPALGPRSSPGSPDAPRR